WIVRNAGAVTSFCNDVVGDVAGTLSGAVGAAIVFRLASGGIDLADGVLSVLVISLTSAVTVGGKASLKSLAISRAAHIVFLAGRLLRLLERAGLIRLQIRKNNKVGRARA